MDRVYQANVSTIPTAAPAPGAYGFVQSDVPLPSFDPTEPGAFAIQYVTESFMAVIEAAGLTPDASNLGQLFQAVQLLVASAPTPPPPTPTPPPPPTDPYFANVALLLHFDGSDGSTSTFDSSGSPHSMTMAAGAALSSAQAKFGPTSLHATGSGLVSTPSTYPTADNLQFGAQEFTHEFWIYPTALTAGYVFNFAETNTYSPGTVIFHNDASITFQATQTDLSTGGVTGPAVPLNQWTFVQVRRRFTGTANDQFEIAYNGVDQHGANTIPHGAVLYHTLAAQFGGAGSVSFPFVGFIDDYRLTIGVARAFNLPTAPFPDA